MLWVGCTLCGLIAVAFVASGRWQVTLRVGHAVLLCSTSGSIFVLSPPLARSASVRAHLFVIFAPNDTLSALRHPFGWRSWNAWRAHWPTSLGVPLYAALVAVAIPTLLVWRFVPKFPRGHCRRCGYNLKGLTEARCPECGTGFGRCTEQKERTCHSGTGIMDG